MVNVKHAPFNAEHHTDLMTREVFNLVPKQCRNMLLVATKQHRCAAMYVDKDSWQEKLELTKKCDGKVVQTIEHGQNTC